MRQFAAVVHHQFERFTRRNLQQIGRETHRVVHVDLEGAIDNQGALHGCVGGGAVRVIGHFGIMRMTTSRPFWVALEGLISGPTAGANRKPQAPSSMNTRSMRVACAF